MGGLPILVRLLASTGAVLPLLKSRSESMGDVRLLAFDLLEARVGRYVGRYVGNG